MNSQDLFMMLKKQGIDFIKELKDPKNIVEAEQFLEKLAQKDREGPRKKIPIMNAKRILELYENSLINRSDATSVQYMEVAEDFMHYLKLNSVNIASLDLEHCESYMSLQKKRRKFNVNTQARLTYIIRNFLKFLQERGYMKMEPEKFNAPRKVSTDAKREIVTKDDFLKLMNYIDTRKERFKNENLTYRVIVSLLYCTGMRRSKLIDLNWKEIQLNQNKIILSNTKGGKNRKIKIGKNLKDLLIEYRKARGFYKDAVVRGAQGKKRLNKNSLQNIVKGLYKKTRIYRPGLCIHSFRHAYITNVCKKAGPEVAKECAGHSRIDTTGPYIHNTEEDLDNAIIDIELQKPDSE